MSEVSLRNDSHRTQRIRSTLLILALLTSPILCCGGMQVLDALPSSSLPGSLDFMVNLFEGEARVENNTSHTLYLTAITTTYGYPMVISQNLGFRQRDVPVRSQESVTLNYDSADLPLAGIAVCKAENDCRLLPASNSSAYELNSYEDLESLGPSWMAAIRSRPRYNYSSIILAASSLVPVLLFSSWLYLRRVVR